MKEQIKELRIRIDGISQLVKSLHEPLKYLDINSSQNMNVEEMIKLMGETGITHFASLEPISITSSHNELSKCYDSLILAKAWLGKVLGELGETSPYTNDGNRKAVEDIEPAADKGFKYIQISETEDYIINDGIKWSSLNYIEKVDWLRQEIQFVINQIMNLPQFGGASGIDVKHPREASIARTNCYNHLCEARFWLGFELQRIKEQSDKSFPIHTIKEEGINFNK